MAPKNAEEARQEWLSQVKTDSRTTEKHHAAAEVIASSPVAPDEHVEAADELVRLGHLIRNTDGTYVPVDRKWQIG